jgi:hypothetical protein
MKNTILKNGKVATTVWANLKTKELYIANRNSFGYNALSIVGDWFYAKYGRGMKTTQGRADSSKFYYSAKSMENAGFQLLKRGEVPLF